MGATPHDWTPDGAPLSKSEPHSDFDSLALALPESAGVRDSVTEPDELVMTIGETVGQKIRRQRARLDEEARKGAQVCLLIGRSTRLTRPQKASLGVCAWATTLIFRTAVSDLRGKDPGAIAAALDLDPDTLGVVCVDLLQQAGMQDIAARWWPALVTQEGGSNGAE